MASAGVMLSSPFRSAEAALKPVCSTPPGAPDDQKMRNPYPLCPETKAALGEALAGQMVLGLSAKPAANGLSFVVCRRGKGEYTMLVSNSTWKELPFKIVSHAGRIAKVEELALEAKELDDPAYVVDCIDRATVGRNTAKTIVGGGTRAFRVKLANEKVRELAAVVPPANPSNRMLFVRDHDNAVGAIKEAVLRRPSFFQQYGGVMLDWRYLWSRSKEDVEEQANWVKKQQLAVGVDFGSGLNFYPDLRIVTNNTFEIRKSIRKIDDVVEKLGILGGRELVMTMHKSGFAYHGAKGKDAFKEEFTAGLKRLARKAAEKGITVYLRNTHRRGPGAVDEVRGYVAAVAEPNMKYAPSVAHDILGQRNSIDHTLEQSARRAVESGSDLVYLSVPVKGFAGHFETAFGRLAEAKDQADLNAALAILKKSGARIVFAPFYDSFDQEYEDLKIFEAAK